MSHDAEECKHVVTVKYNIQDNVYISGSKTATITVLYRHPLKFLISSSKGWVKKKREKIHMRLSNLISHAS